MKRHIVAILSLVLLLFVGGCNSSDASSTEQKESLNKLDRKIVELEQTINDQQKAINEHEVLIDLKDSQIIELEKALALLQEKTSMMDIDFQVLNDLVNQTINSRTAIFDSAEISGDKLELSITYAEFVQDEDSPNGFYLEESEENVVISIDGSVPIYLLNRTGDMYPKEVQWQEVVELGGGFLKLYEKNGQVVFIYELYLP